MADAGPEVFDEHLDSWRAWQRTPWGRLRYRVVAETLGRACAALGDRPLRVLDVGGGDGADSLRLAGAGHDVTVVDISARLLDVAESEAAARGLADRVAVVHAGLDAMDDLAVFDLVLCHNVVQYRDDLGAAVTALGRRVGPGGSLSLLAPNPAAEVMSSAITGEDPATARQLLTSTALRTATFDHDVRRIPVEDAAHALRAVGFGEQTTYGIQCVTHLVPNRRKEEPEFYAELEALELALCDLEPFLRVARFWQVVARRV
jgi:S-adenosylmethionine-dependent methyltransferase